MDGAMSSDFVDISIFNRSFSVLSPDGKWFQKTTPCIRPRLVVRKSSIPEIINLLFHGAFYRSKYPESSGLWRASLNPKEIINIICDSGLGLGPDPDGVLPQHSITSILAQGRRNQQKWAKIFITPIDFGTCLMLTDIVCKTDWHFKTIFSLMCRILPVESSTSFDSSREEVGQGDTSQTLLKNGNVQERYKSRL